MVISLAAAMGGSAAATIAVIRMLSTFKSIRFGLIVGIGSDAPSRDADLRLGDVVLSLPMANFEVVGQWASGRIVEEGRFQQTGILNKLPQILLRAIGKLQADSMINGSNISARVSEIRAINPHLGRFSRRGRPQDRLFEAHHDHVGPEEKCDDCDKQRLVIRNVRDTDEPQVHYGLLESGNQMIGHDPIRDRMAQWPRTIGFETKSAALMDNFPCLVVQGKCDYGDSHRNYEWHKYAGVTAAAYAKSLLAII